ncbi:MAG TPA: TIGR01777 family protein [bacterium]|nr:TIGR01777 family protein [bacterium]
MKIIITGATGFIGSAACEMFADKGCDVAAVTRDTSAAAMKGLRYISWEALDGEADGADAIINLAGENIGASRWTRARMDSLMASRVMAGTRVANAVKKAKKKPGLLIQASAAGFYGDRKDEEITEESAPGKGFLAEVCAAWEGSTLAVEKAGVRRCVLRMGVVLGRGGFLKKIETPFRFFLGGPMGSGLQKISWIHIEDLLSLFRFCVENKSAAGIYNACSPNPATNRELSSALGKALKRPSFFRAPETALKLLLGKMADEAILTGASVLPARLMKEGFVFRYYDIEEALKEIYG